MTKFCRPCCYLPNLNETEKTPPAVTFFPPPLSGHDCSFFKVAVRPHPCPFFFDTLISCFFHNFVAPSFPPKEGTSANYFTLHLFPFPKHMRQCTSFSLFLFILPLNNKEMRVAFGLALIEVLFASSGVRPVSSRVAPLSS